MLNRILEKIFGTTPGGDRKVWTHWRGSEDRQGNPKFPVEGQWWMHSPLGVLQFSWHLWSTHSFAGFHVQSDSEDGGISFHTKLIPVSLFLNVPVPSKRWKKKYGYRHTNFVDVSLTREDDVALRWQFGGDTMSWSNKTPKWKYGSFSFTDFVLGKRDYTEGEPEVFKVKIPMPEGAYDATVELSTDVWARARWFPLKIRRAHVKVPLGIPFPGKGENSYDCGDDASYGITCPAETVEQAIGEVVSGVFRNRRRNGKLMMEYPPPEVREVEVAKLRAEAAKRNRDEGQAESNAKPGPSA